MKRQNRQFTKFISLLKFPGLQYSELQENVPLPVYSAFIHPSS